MLMAACGSTTPAASSSSSGGTTAPTATATPTAVASTPGPASVTATLTGEGSVNGALVMGTVHFVNCDEPSLNGETIDAFESSADSAVGAFLTIREGTITVRLGSGSGTSYSERDFSGSGVTGFNPTSGAQFSSSLTEVSNGGGSKGTIGSLSSISGSVSCGTLDPGGGTVTVTGDTGSGMISGALTSLRVSCTTTAAGRALAARGLSQVGSTPALVSINGGSGAYLFVTAQTASQTYEYALTTAGAGVTFASGGATLSATPHQTGTGAVATRTVALAGTVTCGT